MTLECFTLRGLCSCFFNFSHLFGEKMGNSEGSPARAGMAMMSCHPSSPHGDIPVLSILLSLFPSSQHPSLSILLSISSPLCSPSPLPPQHLWNVTAPSDFLSGPATTPGFNLSVKTCGRTSGKRKAFPSSPFSSLPWGLEWAGNSKVIC